MNKQEPKVSLSVPTGNYLWVHYGSLHELISPSDFLLDYRIKRAVKRLKKRYKIIQKYTEVEEL